MENNTIYNGDCLELMKDIEDESVDCIICDLPYGTTACSWDSIIPFDKLWEQYKRIRKDNAPIVLFGSEPFSTYLRMSNINEFKYDWIWQKNKATGFLNAKKQPLNDYEIISVFYKHQCTYNPQKTKAEKVYKRGFIKRKTSSDCYGKQTDFIQEDDGMRYPKRIIYFNNNQTNIQIHPTQKPVELLEYLIKTYSNEGDLILDNCSGSGTTAVACHNLKRRFICIEKDKEYYEKSIERLKQAQIKQRLF